jgi:hypothetical protein
MPGRIPTLTHPSIISSEIFLGLLPCIQYSSLPLLLLSHSMFSCLLMSVFDYDHVVFVMFELIPPLS